MDFSRTFVFEIIIFLRFFFSLQTRRFAEGTGALGTEGTSDVGDGMAIDRCTTISRMGTLHDSHTRATHPPVSASTEQNRLELVPHRIQLYYSIFFFCF